MAASTKDFSRRRDSVCEDLWTLLRQLGTSCLGTCDRLLINTWEGVRCSRNGLRGCLASKEHDGGFAPEAQLGQRAAILLLDALQERRDRLVVRCRLAPEHAISKFQISLA